MKEVEVRGGIDVGVALSLRGEVGLTRAAAEERAEQAVLHVHLVYALLNLMLDVADVRTRLRRAVQVTVNLFENI